MRADAAAGVGSRAGEADELSRNLRLGLRWQADAADDPRLRADPAEWRARPRLDQPSSSHVSLPRRLGILHENAKQWRACNLALGAKMAMEGLIVLIWHIMANADGDEDADGDGGRPGK